MGGYLMTMLHDLKVFWRILVIIFTPVICLPLIIVLKGEAARCAYTIINMAVFWITEALPLPVTALLPVVFYPLLGVMSGKEVAMYYIQDTSLVFIAGLMMALTIENVNLHKRFGTGILLKIGATPVRILVGFMLPAWFLSMWISNTATTSMMIPAAEAVAGQLRLGMKRSKFVKMGGKIEKARLANDLCGGDSASGENNMAYDNNEADVTRFKTDNVADLELIVGQDAFSHYYPSEKSRKKYDVSSGENKNGEVYAINLDNQKNKEIGDDDQSVDSLQQTSFTVTDVDEIEGIQLDEAEEKKLHNLSKMLCLAIAYSANVGGTATLTGSTTNLLVAEAADSVFRKHDMTSPLTYASWLFFGLPHSFICLIILWLWLQLYFLGWRSFTCKKDEDFASQEKALKNIMKKEYEKLGNIKFGEIWTTILLIVMVLLWLTRDPGFMPGYASLFKKGFVTDATPAILIAVILFIFPSEKPRWLCLRDRSERATCVPSLLNWNLVSTKLPWGPLLLLGGGFAMAKGCESSGLSTMVGDQLAKLAHLEVWVIALVVTIIMSFVTEIMSNTAVVALFLPILEAMSSKIGINPLYLMLPVGMAASYAFMLPIATPPNAIVFSFGHLKVIDMIKVGFVMNCLCILVVTIGINTWGMALFNLNEIPWNTTTTTVNSTT